MSNTGRKHGQIELVDLPCGHVGRKTMHHTCDSDRVVDVVNYHRTRIEVDITAILAKCAPEIYNLNLVVKNLADQVDKYLELLREDLY